MLSEWMISSTDKKEKTKIGKIFFGTIIVHIIAFGLIVIVPLLTAQELPQIQIITVKLGAPPPPPPPPPPPAKKKKVAKKKKEKKQETKKPKVLTGKLVAPVDVPEEIVEEDISDIGFEGGVEGGIEGGVAGGVLGGVLGGVITGAGEEEQTKAVRIIKPPRIIRRVMPSYPEVARKARITGVVIVECETDIRGRVRKVKILRGHPLLNQSAVEAVKKWLFEPMIIDGVPQPVKFVLTVRFTFK